MHTKQLKYVWSCEACSSTACSISWEQEEKILNQNGLQHIDSKHLAHPDPHTYEQEGKYPTSLSPHRHEEQGKYTASEHTFLADCQIDYKYALNIHSCLSDWLQICTEHTFLAVRLITNMHWTYIPGWLSDWLLICTEHKFLIDIDIEYSYICIEENKINYSWPPTHCVSNGKGFEE